jgi:uncharacterized coiled-coil protein SlyX
LTTEDTPRASLASVDARVARLERAQAETDTKIGLLNLEQQHTRELMNSRFETLEMAVNAQTQKLDAFIGRIESVILTATKNSGDLSSSPVGREVDRRLTKLEAATEVHESFIDQLKGMGTAMRWVIGSSVLGVITGVVGLIFSAMRVAGH